LLFHVFNNKRLLHEDVFVPDERKFSFIIFYTLISLGDRALDMWKCVKDSGCNFVGRNSHDSPEICMCEGSSGLKQCVAIRCKRNHANSIYIQTIKFACKYDLSKISYCPQTSNNKPQHTNAIDDNKSDTFINLPKG
jgi:hypothetical protein